MEHFLHLRDHLRSVESCFGTTLYKPFTELHRALLVTPWGDLVDYTSDKQGNTVNQ